jgi:thymidylate kinase
MFVTKILKNDIMLEQGNYRSLCVEGLDHSGKADATLTFLENMLESDISVTHISFPVYASPFGAAIRRILSNGLEDMDMSIEEQTKAKMALFALDRLQVLDILLSSDEYKETLLVFDRSPFSNAITIGYLLAQEGNIKQESAEELVDFALSLEQYMISQLGLDRCVVQTEVDQGGWKNVRNGEKDIYETMDVQSLSEQIYSIFASRIGDSWHKIVTREGESWKERDDIFNDIFSKVFAAHGELPSSDTPRKQILNISQILSLYPGASVEDILVEKYLKALESNEKDEMHHLGNQIAMQILNTSEKFVLKDGGCLDSFRKIVDSCPSCLEVFTRMMGDEYTFKLFNPVSDE